MRPLLPLPPAAVLVTVPTDLVGAPLAWLHDVAIRVGEDLPAPTGDPTTVNMLCKYTGAAALATKAGQEVRVECDSPVTGRAVTIQMRCEALQLWGPFNPQ